jgi:signal transduction histidine kinase
VPPEDRERIFERFARRDPARSRGGGAGLGLAISREIVASHRGRIWVEQRGERGSVFVLALPI